MQKYYKLCRSIGGPWLALPLVFSHPGEAHDAKTAEPIEVTGSRDESLLGVADSATEGTVAAEQLELRPLLRPGEMLEAAPGIIVTQHSGGGKANQYFLRGFNLDHGTDLAITVAGLPLNMPTHAHGQGYADSNFIIPELVSAMQYKKGPYFADVGDFGAAGAVDVSYANKLEQPLASLSVGAFNYRRFLLAASPKLAGGRLIGALELSYTDGPWIDPEAFTKYNGFLRFSTGTDGRLFRTTLQLYHGLWNSTDQIPQRAIQDGTLDRFGTVDPSDGGITSRVAFNTEILDQREKKSAHLNVYLLYYRLDLWSNFTYFLDDPDNGDQFEQEDQRITGGLQSRYNHVSRLGSLQLENSVGIQARADDILTVGLYHTKERERLETTRADQVFQFSTALWAQNGVQWTPWLRSLVGLRADLYHFQVQAGLEENSGTATASIVSPKAALIFGPWSQTELYLNAGRGFHSNDGRGLTIAEDPNTDADEIERTAAFTVRSDEPDIRNSSDIQHADHGAASSITPLVPARGAEVGIRTATIPHLQATLSLWTLRIDSELLFVGDAGTTEASRASERTGLEFANFLTPRPWLLIDADFAYTKARFTDNDPVGAYVPGAIEGVVSIGANLIDRHGISIGSRLRYFGPRPLIEDNSIRSDASTLLAARLGYSSTKGWEIALDIYNLLNSEVSDQDYYYASRLEGESNEGIEDIHTHPAEPRSFRLSFQGKF